MIKVILLATAFSISQIAFAEMSALPNKKATDMAAVNMAHAAAKKDGKNVPFWTANQTKQAELEAKYKKQIADNPEEKKAYAFLAGLYLTNNKTSKAIDAYQDAISHDAENPKLFAAISIAYLHHSKYDMAKAMADQALLLDPKLKQVGKISEYIVAKQDAIKAASKVPSNDTQADSSKRIKAVGVKPNDLTHK